MKGSRICVNRIARAIGGIIVTYCSVTGWTQQGQPPEARVIASCDFEGPYSAGEQQVHDGCANNGQWGRKDMLLKADKDTGRSGTVQRIQVRGITSGGMQFFYTKLKLKKDRYYKVSYWLKSDGLEGPVRCYVRKIAYPWTVYLWADYVPRTSDWKEYSFSGKCAEDVNDDVGVCWETGSLGTIWLDDLKVEESEYPFASGSVSPSPKPSPPGGDGGARRNFLPRSSFEGKWDHFWCQMFFGWARNGVWEGVEGDWEDPQMYQAEGGKVGKYCMAVPNAVHAGQPGTHSITLDLLPSKPYTVSAWMKADPPGLAGSIALLYWWSGRHQQSFGSAYPKLTAEWQRVSFTAIPQSPPGSADTTRPIQAIIQIAPSATQHGTLFVDGLQLEAGDKATDYKPRYPLELYADVAQPEWKLPGPAPALVEWGQVVPLDVLAAAADPVTQASSLHADRMSAVQKTKVELVVTGYPGIPVSRKLLNLTVDKSTRVNLGIKRRGLFRVSLRTLNDTEAAPQETVFAIVPKPRDTGLSGMFGEHIALRPFHANYIRRLGFTWTRIHDCSRLTKWDSNEPVQGKLYFHDEVVDGVLKSGLHILGLPDDPPAWAKRKGEDGTNPVDAAAYGKYCEEIARHYRGKIDHWELWNEPYLSYSGGPKLFGELLQAGYAGIKRGNPDAKVLGWCADVSQPSWGAQIPEEARKCIDIFSFHNYPNNLSGGGTLPFAAELPDHRKQWPPQVTECWNTEGTNGEVCANSMYTFLPVVTAEKNDRACAFASRVWIEHKKAGVDKFFVYQMHNTDSMMYFGGYQSLFIGHDRSPTPAAIATATTAYCIDGLKFVPFKPVEGVVQGLFEGDSRATWAVYDDAGVMGKKRLNLTKLPKDAEVLDVMGNDPRRDGKTTWEIGIQPLFVLSGKLSAEKLSAMGRGASHD